MAVTYISAKDHNRTWQTNRKGIWVDQPIGQHIPQDADENEVLETLLSGGTILIGKQEWRFKPK